MRDEVARHGDRLGVGYSVRVVDDIQPESEVVGDLIAVRDSSSRGVNSDRIEECTHPVDAYPFDHGVHLMPPLAPLALLVVIHDIILYFVEQTRTCPCQWTSGLSRKADAPSGSDKTTLISGKCFLRYTPVPAIVPPVPLRNRQSSRSSAPQREHKDEPTCTAHKRIDVAAGLAQDFRSRTMVVRLEITLILKLVGKETPGLPLKSIVNEWREPDSGDEVARSCQARVGLMMFHLVLCRQCRDYHVVVLWPGTVLTIREFGLAKLAGPLARHVLPSISERSRPVLRTAILTTNCFSST